MDAHAALAGAHELPVEPAPRPPTKQQIRDLAHVLLAAADDAPKPELETAGDLASAFLRGYRRGSETRAAYARDLAVLFLWLRHRGPTPFGATRAHLADWIAQPRSDGQPYAPTTIARRLSCASGFYSYAVDENLIARNPTKRLRRPKLPDAPGSLGHGKRDARALFARPIPTLAPPF